MTAAMLQVAGGLGLFLLGMTIMTEGLRGVAGAALRSWLARFTSSPLRGAASGALTTALVQSSSATTVAAVGFAGAGLLTFPQALGVVFGANLGTTVTGWLVAVVGFKLKLGEMLLPLILLGALLRLFGRGRTVAAGSALSGFGLLFVGIAALQSGMAGFEGSVTPASFPPDSWSGRAGLLFTGVLITLVTQSSSAGVVTALAALSSGAIELRQAAALVIGMDVGTTVTAVVATIGGTVAARRTGWAHVVYNVATATGAFFLIGPFLALCVALAPDLPAGDPELVLVAFHTTFNALGVVAILPATKGFARLLEWLIPDRPRELARRLDGSLVGEPEVALEAASATAVDLARAALGTLAMELSPHPDRSETPERQRVDTLDEIDAGIAALRSFVARIDIANSGAAFSERLAAALHAVDHVDRLVDRLGGEGLVVVRDTEALRPLAAEILACVSGGNAPREDAACRVWAAADAAREPLRRELLAAAASGRLDPGQALAQLDGVRAVRRVSYHVWRIAHHLHRIEDAAARRVPESDPPRFESEVPD